MADENEIQIFNTNDLIHNLGGRRNAGHFIDGLLEGKVLVFEYTSNPSSMALGQMGMVSPVPSAHHELAQAADKFKNTAFCFFVRIKSEDKSQLECLVINPMQNIIVSPQEGWLSPDEAIGKCTFGLNMRLVTGPEESWKEQLIVNRAVARKEKFTEVVRFAPETWLADNPEKALDLRSKTKQEFITPPLAFAETESVTPVAKTGLGALVEMVSNFASVAAEVFKNLTGLSR